MTDGPREKILLVHDSAVGTGIPGVALARAWCDVETVKDIAGAVEALRLLTPSCVVASVDTPGTDGCELCRLVRSDPRLASVPVVLFCGRADADIILRGLEAGADTLVVLPLDPDELARRVREVTTAARLDGRLGEPSADAGRRRMLRYIASVTANGSDQASKMKAIGRLAAGLAHDFNNIFQVIQGFTDFLLGRTTAEDRFHKPLQQIRTSVEKAVALTQQLIVIGLKQVHNPQVLDLGVVVEGMAARLREVIGDRVALTILSEAGLWKVRVDRGAVEYALRQLAQNARNAIGETDQEGELAIETANVARGVDGGRSAGSPVDPVESVCCIVRNNGRTMDPATLAHVFEPFFTTKDTGWGAGLGLATVYGAVTQSGGSIQCRGGTGTEFRILFPRWTGASP